MSFGSIHIVDPDTVIIPLRAHPGLRHLPLVPFLEIYTARVGPEGGAVYDGETLIASMGRGDSLIVAEAYRGKGIGTELAMRWRERNPRVEFKVRGMTPAAKAIHDKVWAKYGKERRDR